MSRHFVLVHSAWHGGWAWDGVIAELPDGTSQVDLVPPEAAQGWTAAAGATPDNAVPVVPDVVRDMLMPKEPKEIQDALIAKPAPQPLTLFTTRIDAMAFAALDVPKAVVFCRDRASLPPGAFLGMAQSLGDFDLVETRVAMRPFLPNRRLWPRPFCRWRATDAQVRCCDV